MRAAGRCGDGCGGWWLPWLAAAAVVAGLPSAARAQRNLKDIPPTDPELERKALVVPADFEITLFASEPLLNKPIHMNFDARGRLWVACSDIYPQIKPGQKADDKVVILEDVDGDGKADKSTTFAEGLLIPTAVEPDGRGGCWVGAGTELLHFADEDGDGKADKRTVALSGFGTEDTHHIIHTFRTGHDGRLWFNQSIYIHSHVETPFGPRRLGGGGVWRWRPETGRLEVFVRGLVNSWGHHFDRWGNSLLTDGAGGEGVNYGLPGAWYVSAPGAVRLLKGLNPGSPKYCGLEIVDGGLLPAEWRGNLITADFRAHRVCRFVLSEDGAGYAAREMPELVKSTHGGFRPVDIKVGPDGAIYVADFYNPIIQHGEVDFRDPRRDKGHGRIWRIAPKGKTPLPRPRIAGATVPELLKLLAAAEPWTRHHARQELVRQHATTFRPALDAWWKALPAGAEGDASRLEALWTYQSADIVEADLLALLLKAPTVGARSAAARVIPDWAESLKDAVGLLEPLAVDASPRVRLEAVRSLAALPSARSAEVALRAMADRTPDKFLEYALWLTVRDLQPHWQAGLADGTVTFGSDARVLAYVAKASGSTAVLRPVVELLRTGKVPADQRPPVMALLGELGGPAELGLVFDLAMTGTGLTADARAELFATLLATALKRKVVPAGDLNRVADLLAADSKADEAVRAGAARLAGAWKREALRPALERLVSGVEIPDPLRIAAIEGLGLLGGPASIKSLTAAAAPTAPAAGRLPAAGALVVLDTNASAPVLATLLTVLSAEKDDPGPVVASLLQRQGGPALLAAALAGKTIPGDVAKLAVRAARGAGRDDKALIEALQKAGGLSTTPRKRTPEEVAALLDAVKASGDPARGEAIFRRKELGCVKCHAIAGAGGKVGPSLESIGASAQPDYLLESLLDPAAKVKEGYHSVVVRTTDDRVLTGIQVRKSATELVLRDAEDREITIPAGDIEAAKPGGSLMPAGLTDVLTDREMTDLTRFLTELGKVGGKYAVGTARKVRSWQVLDPSPGLLKTMSQWSLGTVLGGRNLPWNPTTTLVSGDLPLHEMPKVALQGRPSTGLARFRIEAGTAGKVRLRVNGIEGLELSVNRDTVPLAGEVTDVELPAGEHVLMFTVDLDRRKAPLRVELEDTPGSPARAQLK